MKKGEPRVGIMWLVRDRLIFDSVPLNEAQTGAGHRDHPRSHIKVWEQLQELGCAPREAEYEEHPRGRVLYDVMSKGFTLLADHCILARPEVVKKIKREMHLPKNTKLSTDSHYNCFKCLHGEGSEEDWDF